MDSIANLVFNGRYRSESKEMSNDLGAAPTKTRVFDTSDRLMLTHTTPGHGWFSQDEWVTGDFLVVEEIRDEPPSVRIVAYDLRTKSAVKVPGPRVTQPEVSASAGGVAYISGTSATRMCVQVWDLESARVRVAACHRKGQVLADVAYNAGRVVYSVIDRPNQKDRCKTVWVAGPDEEPRPMPTRNRCIGWSGAATHDQVAWDEADPLSEQLAWADAYLQHADGSVAKVGSEIDTDTIVSCADSFYWVVDEGDGARVRTWDADGGAVDVWAGVQDSLALSLRCADDRWLQMSVDVMDGKSAPTEFLAMDLRPD